MEEEREEMKRRSARGKKGGKHRSEEEEGVKLRKGGYATGEGGEKGRTKEEQTWGNSQGRRE
jgi:hypothetical protein